MSMKPSFSQSALLESVAQWGEKFPRTMDEWKVDVMCAGIPTTLAVLTAKAARALQNQPSQPGQNLSPEHE